MSGFIANENGLVVPTRKRNYRGEMIHRLINVNDDCWNDICSKMNWQTWANLCAVHPQMEKYRHGRANHALNLNMRNRMPRAIFNALQFAKTVVLEDGSQSSIFLFLENYEQMTSVEDLTIVDSYNFITFIKSTNVKKLRILFPKESTFLDPTMRDTVEPLLEISNKIEQFIQNGGGLYSDSITALFRNPLKILCLHNTQIEDIELFSTGFLTANLLKILSLTGNISKDIQKSFLTGPIENREKIEQLEIEILPTISIENYSGLLDCTNLKYIGIHFRSFKKAILILSELLNMHHLTFVMVMMPKDFTLSPDDDTILAFYTSLFKHKNVTMMCQFPDDTKHE